MRNPNGYGSVVKLSGNRRNPYAVRKTKGFDSRGYPVYEILGYTPTREAGMLLLARYNDSPWDVDGAKTTFEELFELWKEKKAPKLGDSNRKAMNTAFRHCVSLHEMKYKAVKAHHMQACIDGCNKGYATQGAIKNLFHHLDRFALELDISSRRYSDLLTCDSAPETSRRPFTEDEIQAVWAASDMPWADTVLLFLYTGFRLSELLGLRADDIDMEAGTAKNGVKSEAGKDRIVPMHSRILPFFQKRASEGGEWLICLDGKKTPTAKYYERWHGIMKALGMEHTPHECRHTFRSRLDSAGANKRCIDLLMGHKSKDVGERVYTHKTIDELRAAIELLP